MACRGSDSPVFHPACSRHPSRGNGWCRPTSGVSAHDALVHVAQYLRGAYDCGYEALEHLDDTGKSLFWSNLNAIEMAEGLVEALLDGIESQPIS